MENHPVIAARSCEDCQKFLYADVPGKPPATEPSTRGGVVLLRPSGSKPPCRYKGTPCPKGTPENPKTLTPENRIVLEHYRQCAATGHFPDDPIVKHNAALIRQVLDRIDRERRETLALLTGKR